MKVCLGWSHPTPDRVIWDGKRLTVTKKVPDWLDRTGWEKDFGDGTVPAVSAVPIELSHHNEGSFVRLRDRHVPMAGAEILGELLRANLARQPVDWIRGDADHPPALGLDLDELHGADQPIPLTVTVREVDADLAAQAVWVRVTPVDLNAPDTPAGRGPAERDAIHAPVAEVRLDFDTAAGQFTGALPGAPPGLYEVTVSARAVPGAGDLSTGDTIAVIDSSTGGGADD